MPHTSQTQGGGGLCLSWLSSWMDEDISVCFSTVIRGKRWEQSLLHMGLESIFTEVTCVTSALILLVCYLVIYLSCVLRMCLEGRRTRTILWAARTRATRQKPTAKTNGELHSQRPPNDKNMMKKWVSGFDILSTSGYLLNPTMSRLAVTRETKSLNDWKDGDWQKKKQIGR